MTTGQIIRWSTAGAVAGVAAVAAVASCEHACALVRAHGETGWIGRLVPLTVDGLIYPSSAGTRIPKAAVSWSVVPTARLPMNHTASVMLLEINLA